MEQDETLETVTAAPRVIISYDVKSRRTTEACLVQQYVFGRAVTMKTKGGVKRYTYEGLIHKPAVERLGQSVLMMREDEAERFAGFLAKHRVPYSRERIWVEA